MKITAMINLNDIHLFRKNKKSLKKISKDAANDAYMTELKIKAVDFDTVKEKYVKRLNGIDGIKSNDALFEDKQNHVLVFVEFKNGNISDSVSKRALREKIFDSMAIFSDLTNKTLGFSRLHMEYVLVYNGTKNPCKDAIKTRIARKAQQEIIHFGLSKFKHYFFKDVHTYTKEEFNKKYAYLR